MIKSNIFTFTLWTERKRILHIHKLYCTGGADYVHGRDIRKNKPQRKGEGHKSKSSSTFCIVNNSMKNIDKLSNYIIGCAIDVHKELGPGLLESVYQDALCIELKLKGISFQQEYRIPLFYKGHEIKKHFIIDVFVESEIIIELKSIISIQNIHLAQLMTYLKLTNKHLGLLINFNVPLLKEGIRRIVT